MKNKDTVRVISEDKLVLQLYVSGMSPKSMEAIENIKRLSEEHLAGAFELEIIDIYKHPEVAAEQHIIFSPSLIKQLPLPRKTLIGTLADTEKVVKALGIQFNGS
ncbi:circadian clock protein KaiB [Arenibacter sp. BSSL-BM3]|uniref:Circadian clock protein KaiB n=1 Tax=Arenibacter arenosicollis TaxID=2762274 RepID=A0ABR7QPT7_9FLAO|nr:circadian clock KaiB family protein [Arenibacter arenosicollis]MBC8769210.1 circadian clock protein KaiB [Arenibacter arenosicollis]